MKAQTMNSRKTVENVNGSGDNEEGNDDEGNDEEGNDDEGNDDEGAVTYRLLCQCR